MADHHALLRPGGGLGLPPPRPSRQHPLAAAARRRPPADEPRWAGIAVGASHCAAGCTLGDIIAEFGLFALGATIAGTTLWGR